MKEEREGADSMKTTAYNVCFAGLSESLTPVANMCLASLIHHETALRHLTRACEGRRSILLAHPLFANTGRLGSLRELIVQTNAYEAEDYGEIQVSGVPPHCTIMGNLQRAITLLEALPTQLNSMKTDLISTLTDEFRRTATDGEHGQYGGVEGEFKSAMQPIVQELQQAIQHVQPPAQSPQLQLLQQQEQAQVVAVASNSDPDGLTGSSLYMWNGRIHRIPENFQFPQMITAEQLMMRWLLGDADQKIRPFRLLTSKDFERHDKTNIKRFLRGAQLCKYIEEQINLTQDNDIDFSNISAETAKQLYVKVKNTVERSPTAMPSAKHRANQLSWVTVYHAMIKVQKTATAE